VSGKPVALAKSARSIPQQVINEESGPDGDVSGCERSCRLWALISSSVSLVTFKITFWPTRTLIFDTFGVVFTSPMTRRSCTSGSRGHGSERLKRTRRPIIAADVARFGDETAISRVGYGSTARP
jgi:hypothetical protein